MNPEKDDQKRSTNNHSGGNTNKAHMLVAMLGQEFTKSADHPFFAKLNAIVSTPDPESTPVPKGSLDRLLASLPSKANDENKDTQNIHWDADPNDFDRTETALASSATLRNLGEQHPAVIAHYLVNNAPDVRMEVINSLKGSTARQAAVYFTRFLSKLEKST